MSSDSQVSIAYAALYPDEKESFETAEAQVNDDIDQAAAQGRDPSDIYIAVDIIATPEQIAKGVAEEYARRILHFIDTNYPQTGRAAGISDDATRRPLRDMLITHKLTDADIDGLHLRIIE
jgi:hypothetical protein